NTSVMAAGNFLIPNGTFIAELIAFLIVLFVLWRYVVPPVSKAMSDRQAMIKAQLDEGREASERLKQAEADYRSAMEEARTTAATIRDQARADAAAIREEMLEQAVQERDRVLESGREQLQHERDARWRTCPGRPTTGWSCCAACCAARSTTTRSRCSMRWSPAAGRGPASCATPPNGSASRRSWPRRNGPTS